MSKVFLLDPNKRPLNPVHPAHARQLLKNGLASVLKRFPLDISEKYQYLSLTGFNQAIANCKRQSLSTQKSGFEIVTVDNNAKLSIYTH